MKEGKFVTNADGSTTFTIDNEPYGKAKKKSIETGMENPMTAAEDIIVGGTNGTPTRLAKGANGTFLGVDENGQLAYAQAGGGELYEHSVYGKNDNCNFAFIVYCSESSSWSGNPKACIQKMNELGYSGNNKLHMSGHYKVGSSWEDVNSICVYVVESASAYSFMFDYEYGVGAVSWANFMTQNFKDSVRRIL